jgi:hypothetical protein
MQLFRCPSCRHWKCFQCDDRKGYQLRCCKCNEAASAGQWYYGQAKGRPHDLEYPPRLGTGRPRDASKTIAERLLAFCERYGVSLNSIARHTTISPWSVRQARAGKRNLPPIQEKLIDVTIQRIQSGGLWVRRINSQRRDLVRIDPPYGASCAMHLSHCHGGLLPGSCPRRWKECRLSSNDWELVEELHKNNVGLGSDEKKVSGV